MRAARATSGKASTASPAESASPDTDATSTDTPPAGTGHPARKSQPAGKKATSRTTKSAATKPAARTGGAQPSSTTTATTTSTADTPTTHVEKKSAVTSTSTTSPGLPDAASLPVRPGEDPWTEEEVAEVRADLEAVIARQIEQIEIVNAELQNLLRDGNDGAGRDPADVGSTNFERDQEMSLAANAREMLEQSLEAVRHIDNGTYGICDHCHEPIGKGRLQAFPRATLCVTCKQREERR